VTPQSFSEIVPWTRLRFASPRDRFCPLHIFLDFRGDFAVLSSRFYAALLVAGLGTPASADMIYKPVNPSFGGDSFNSSHLQGLASSENQFKASASSAQESTSERFISMLESRLYSSLASQVSDAIFGANAQPSGTITFDDQTITFVNNGTNITLTVVDSTSGQVTNIVIPSLH
jgi:curli production assembly/transport component CsgF